MWYDQLKRIKPGYFLIMIQALAIRPHASRKLCPTWDFAIVWSSWMWDSQRWWIMARSRPASPLTRSSSGYGLSRTLCRKKRPPVNHHRKHRIKRALAKHRIYPQKFHSRDRREYFASVQYLLSNFSYPSSPN